MFAVVTVWITAEAISNWWPYLNRICEVEGEKEKKKTKKKKSKKIVNAVLNKFFNFCYFSLANGNPTKLVKQIWRRKKQKFCLFFLKQKPHHNSKLLYGYPLKTNTSVKENDIIRHYHWLFLVMLIKRTQLCTIKCWKFVDFQIIKPLIKMTMVVDDAVDHHLHCYVI